MKTPRSIFDRIQTEADIDQMILVKDAETLYLDFKSKKDVKTPVIDEDTPKVLAKALSGFANSAGGVLIFGVDARAGSMTKTPIADLAVFEQNINELIPRSTSFALENVETKKIELHNGEGYLVVHVPESNQAPHRSQKDSKYYFRSGDSFLPMEHYQIADCFGRRHHPDLMVTAKATGNLLNDRVLLEVQLDLNNRGRTLARYPFLELTNIGSLNVNQFGIDGNSKFGLPRAPTREARYRRFEGTQDNCVHSLARLPVLILEQNFSTQPSNPFAIAPVVIEGLLAAEGFPLRKFRIEIDPAVQMELIGSVATHGQVREISATLSQV